MPVVVVLGLLFCWVGAVAAEEAYAKANPVVWTADNYSTASQLRQHLRRNNLFLHSSAAVVYDLRDGQVLYERDADEQRPIASLTKLMTAMVVLDADLPMDEVVTILRKDRDRLRGSKSRLSYGTKLTRKDLLLISLAASENRSAAALARTYPGGKTAFVEAMNRKAKTLGMNATHFADSTGLDDENVSTARDLVTLVQASNSYALINQMSTNGKSYVTDLRKGWKVEFFNTNRLVRRKAWDVDVSKTGYIAASGYCLVMKTTVQGRPLAFVLLNSWGKDSKFGDAGRIKRWLMRAEKRLQKAASQVASAS
jgi:D-alanyl-D-alanine endopeptidase (penicillin-binding protein 7)